jgi:hypothetical protein
VCEMGKKGKFVSCMEVNFQLNILFRKLFIMKIYVGNKEVHS